VWLFFVNFKIMKYTVATLLFWFAVISVAEAQRSILGKWKSLDDDTGEPKSVVEIVERNGKVYGKVVKLFRKPGEDPDPLCDECSEDDPRFKKKVIGMEILQDMVREEEEYSGGHILDPKNGKVYRCKVWLEENDLKVRGYLGPFYRTQTWKRFEG
jgi:uncharacterized protein (DUF2147 family)